LEKNLPCEKNIDAVHIEDEIKDADMKDNIRKWKGI
jgi:hypothetical protein